jgi:hypothetical protein
MRTPPQVITDGTQLYPLLLGLLISAPLLYVPLPPFSSLNVTNVFKSDYEFEMFIGSKAVNNRIKL